MLNGFVIPSRIFGLASKQKKVMKKNLAFFKICFKFKVEEVFEITLFYGTVPVAKFRYKPLQCRMPGFFPIFTLSNFPGQA